MKNEIIKYQHYLLLILALIITQFILEPLWQHGLDTQSKIQLMEKKADKIAGLLSVKEQIDEQDKLISSKLLQLQPYLFPRYPLGQPC